MKEIPLTKGKVALVDDCDHELLSKLKLHARKCGNKWYACHGATDYLHILIMNPSRGMEVDHINGNGLDCTRNNMRVCTHTQNQRYQGKQTSNSSGYIGVSWQIISAKWRAYVSVNSKQVHVGLFNSAEEAAHARDQKAKELHGEFAWLNFKD